MWLKQMQGLFGDNLLIRNMASTGPSSRLMSHFSFGPCVCFNINIQSVTPDWICEVQSWKKTFERGRPCWKTQRLIGWSPSQAPPRVKVMLCQPSTWLEVFEKSKAVSAMCGHLPGRCVSGSGIGSCDIRKGWYLELHALSNMGASANKSTIKDFLHYSNCSNSRQWLIDRLIANNQLLHWLFSSFWLNFDHLTRRKKYWKCEKDMLEDDKQLLLYCSWSNIKTKYRRTREKYLSRRLVLHNKRHRRHCQGNHDSMQENCNQINLSNPFKSMNRLSATQSVSSPHCAA